MHLANTQAKIGHNEKIGSFVLKIQCIEYKEMSNESNVKGRFKKIWHTVSKKQKTSELV